jgi:hypothetical protein
MPGPEPCRKPWFTDNADLADWTATRYVDHLVDATVAHARPGVEAGVIDQRTHEGWTKVTPQWLHGRHREREHAHEDSGSEEGEHPGHSQVHTVTIKGFRHGVDP